MGLLSIIGICDIFSKKMHRYYSDGDNVTMKIDFKSFITEILKRKEYHLKFETTHVFTLKHKKIKYRRRFNNAGTHVAEIFLSSGMVVKSPRFLLEIFLFDFRKSFPLHFKAQKFISLFFR